MSIKIYLFFYLTVGISTVPLFCSPARKFKHVNPSSFLSQLPDNQLLYNLALIGTYQSASIRSVPYLKTQNLTLKEQLESGIRVLDLHLRLENDELKLYYGPTRLLDSIDEVFSEILDFFRRQPRESVIVMMKTEESSVFSKLTECQAVNKSIEDWRSRGLPIIGKWSLLEDRIGEHRGHVLLAHVGNKDFADCTTYLPCGVQNDWFVTETEKKWQIVKKNEDNMLQPYYPYHSCYVNYLAGLNPLLFSHYSKSSGRDLKLRSKQIADINYKMAKYFKNPYNTLAIVITEFPSDKLIQRVISSNFY